MLFGYFYLLMFIGGVINNFSNILFNMINETKYNVVFKQFFSKKRIFNTFSFFIFAIILTVLIIGASYLLVRQNPESEKLSAYECGFEPYEDARHTFDVKFCVIAILFIIFDIEIMFLIPWCVSISKIRFTRFLVYDRFFN
jgi:NADH-quinone oxidoreductase subunit A